MMRFFINICRSFEIVFNIDSSLDFHRFENFGTSAVDSYQWSVILGVIILVLFLKENKRHPQPSKALILLAKKFKDKEDGNV